MAKRTVSVMPVMSKNKMAVIATTKVTLQLMPNSGTVFQEYSAMRLEANKAN